LFAVNGILFNHESPRRGESFVTRKITLGVAAIVHGRKQPLYLGNLDARRDWGFAGDYVDAMWRMMQTDAPNDYVIATGETHSVREFCEAAFAHVDMPLRWVGHELGEKGIGPQGQVLVEIDARYFRPSEVDLLLGDATKARRELGWKPTVGFRQLVHMMVDADCAAVHESGSTGAAAQMRTN
jgi:GDPmannose 4,6-dehydratase